MRLKIEGALILCIVAVFAKTCLEKFTPKVRRTSNNLLPLTHISQTIRRIEKHFFLLEAYLMYICMAAKISFSIFWSIPTWTITLTLEGISQKKLHEGIGGRGGVTLLSTPFIIDVIFGIFDEVPLYFQLSVTTWCLNGFHGNHSNKWCHKRPQFRFLSFQI